MRFIHLGTHNISGNTDADTAAKMLLFSMFFIPATGGDSFFNAFFKAISG